MYLIFNAFFSMKTIFIFFSNFHEDNEGLINRQINLEMYASYAYTAMANYFGRPDVAFKGQHREKLFLLNSTLIVIGHHDYFEKMAKEEFEHANKFMEYQNKRGGTVLLLDIKV